MRLCWPDIDWKWYRKWFFRHVPHKFKEDARRSNRCVRCERFNYRNLIRPSERRAVR